MTLLNHYGLGLYVESWLKSFVISGLPGLWELKYRNLIASVIVFVLTFLWFGRLCYIGHGRGQSLVHLQLHHQSLYINIQQPSSIIFCPSFFCWCFTCPDALFIFRHLAFKNWLESWYEVLNLNRRRMRVTWQLLYELKLQLLELDWEIEEQCGL